MYKIISDTSCDLTKEEIKDLGIEYVPFKISIDDKDYIDDESLNLSEYLINMEKTEKPIKTACPGPFDYLNIYCGPALCSLGGELNGGRILFLPWGLSAHPAGAKWGRVRVLMSARVLRKGRNWAVLLCLRVVCWGGGRVLRNADF